ncbi:MAG: hypothetical protein PHI34_12160 [Acidobacteriota bacterium]|nr:hypothetical protein [Acidobacteriota bacterium]
MELIIRRTIILAAAIVLLASSPAVAGDRIHLTFGVTGFYPSDSVLREIYGDYLTGYQVQASFRFAGNWSIFAGYRSIRTDGAPLVLGEAFEEPSGRIDLDLSSWRGGVLYELALRRWTLSFAVGAGQIVCRESWPEADLSANKKAIGLILSAGADVALFGPLGLFVRLEFGPSERKEDVLLGGFDAVGGLSLRF